MLVSRSLTICEIDTFMTLLSSTITNWAAARTAIGSQAALGAARPARGAGSAEALAAPGTAMLRWGLRARRARNDARRCGSGVPTPGHTPARKVAPGRPNGEPGLMRRGRARYGLLLTATLLSLAVQGIAPPSPV